MKVIRYDFSVGVERIATRFFLSLKAVGKLPFQLRFLFASRPELMGKVLGIVHRAIAMHFIKKARLTRKMA
jgi:hypothetical protein